MLKLTEKVPGTLSHRWLLFWLFAALVAVFSRDGVNGQLRTYSDAYGPIGTRIIPEGE